MSARLLQVLTTSCKMHTKDAPPWMDGRTNFHSHLSYSLTGPPSAFLVPSRWPPAVSPSDPKPIRGSRGRVPICPGFVYPLRPSSSLQTRILRLRYASHTISPRRPVWALAQRLNTDRRLFASHIQSTQKSSPRPLRLCQSHYSGVCDLTSRPNG